jgi:hypothetical protein
MRKKLSISRMFILFLILYLPVSIITAILISLSIQAYKDIRYPYRRFNFNRDVNNVLDVMFSRQIDHVNSMILSGDLPPIGIIRRGHDFRPKSPEWKLWNLWAYKHSLQYPVVISLDYETGRLYTGFTDIYFLKEDFPEELKQRIRDRIIRVNESEGLYGSNFYVQNAKGEPYASGDTIMGLAAILSSGDIETIRK